MDIKKELRTALLKEGKHKSHKKEYGCLMVYLDVEKEEWDKLQDIIDEDDLYQPEDDPTYGREMEPHATILFGFHEDVPDKDVEAEIDEIKEPEIKFKSISSFNNEKFDVLKFDVDSGDMHDLNSKFKKFPHTNNFPDYHPHVTIAYLKPKMAEKYIKKMKDMVNLPIKIDKLVYSKPNGEKKNYKIKKG
jgi:2'-5' RNA ligase